MKKTTQGKTSPETQQKKTQMNSGMNDQSPSQNKQDSTGNDSSMPKNAQGKQKTTDKTNKHRSHL